MLPDLIRREIQLAYSARAQGLEGAIEQWARAKRRAIDALSQQRVNDAAVR
jgi:hypothetical protein